MAEQKEPQRKRETLPPLAHTTIHTLLGTSEGVSPDAATEKIKLLAASQGHASIIGAHVVEENSYQAASMRARAATQQVRSHMPKELRVIERGKTYWHKKRSVHVTVIECSIRRGKNGNMLHKAIDEDDNEIEVDGELLEDRD